MMINVWLNKIDRLNQNNLIKYTVALSIILAAWMQYIQHGWINPDSVLYFEQARLFSIGEWSKGFNIFKWPMYGACIALVHKTTSFDIQQSAQVLNMLFFGIATASFLYIIKLAGGNNRTLFFGTLLLFSSQYIVGDALEMLMRDEGFWAFYLAAIAFFILYCQTMKAHFALLWQSAIIIATLFRIEAILYLLLLPILCLPLYSDRWKYKLLHLAKAYSLSIILATVIAIVLIVQPESNMSQFGRLDEVFTSNLFQKLTAKLVAHSDIMSEQVLGHYLDEFALPGLLLTFIYVIIAKSISTSGLIPITLAGFGIKSTNNVSPLIRRVLLTVIAIALIAALLIIIKVFVLSGRYLVALAWIVLIFASFYLEQLSKKPAKQHRILLGVMLCILSLSLIKNILPKRQGYNYQQDAVAWVKAVNTSDAPVYYEDARLRFYAKASISGTSTTTWQNLESIIENQSLPYAYVVITVNKRDKEKIERIQNNWGNYHEAKRFYSPNKKKYSIVFEKN